MSVPTCKRCGTKFPGKTICKLCGGDPNTEPTMEEKIAAAKAERDAALRDASATLKVTTTQFAGAMKSVGKKARTTAQIIQQFAEEEFPGHRARMRRGHRARIRSLQNSRGARSSYKHGRKGVR